MAALIWRHLPNAISIGRILLVVPVVHYLLGEDMTMALVLFFIAGVSDAVDGFLAKHFGWQSALGGVLDPLADKLLLVSAYVCLYWLEVLPGWLVGLVLFRDLLIVAGALTYHLKIAPFEAHPSRISKLNTLLQIVLVVWILVDLGLTPLPAEGDSVLIVLVALTTLASGFGYVWIWGKRAVTVGNGST